MLAPVGLYKNPPRFKTLSQPNSANRLIRLSLSRLRGRGEIYNNSNKSFKQPHAAKTLHLIVVTRIQK